MILLMACVHNVSFRVLLLFHCSIHLKLADCREVGLKCWHTELFESFFILDFNSALRVAFVLMQKIHGFFPTLDTFRRHSND